MGQDGQSWLELATSLLLWERSLPTGQWGSVNTPSRLTSFPWEQALLWTECSGIFQNGSFPPSPAGSTRALFSNMNCENLVELLETNLTILWGPPKLGLPGLFSSLSCPHWASSHRSATGQVFLPCHWFPQRFCLCLSALVSWGSLYLPISPSWRQWFALCPYLSYGSKKSYWSFSLFSFLLVRMEWWLASSLHAERETGSLHHVLGVKVYNWWKILKKIITKYRDTWPRLKTCKSLCTTENDHPMLFPTSSNLSPIPGQQIKGNESSRGTFWLKVYNMVKSKLFFILTPNS